MKREHVKAQKTTGTVSFVQEIRSELPESHEKNLCLLSLRA